MSILLSDIPFKYWPEISFPNKSSYFVQKNLKENYLKRIDPNKLISRPTFLALLHFSFLFIAIEKTKNAQKHLIKNAI